RIKPQLIQTVPQPGSMACFEARREGLNHQLVPFKSPPIPRNARNAAKIHGFCAAVSELRIHFPPAASQERTVTPARVSAPTREPLVGVGRLAARSCRNGRASSWEGRVRSVVLGQAAAEALASCTVTLGAAKRISAALPLGIDSGGLEQAGMIT